MWFYHGVMSPKDADRMANSVDPDQTAPHLELHWLQRPVCPKTGSLWQFFSESEFFSCEYAKLQRLFPRCFEALIYKTKLVILIII